MNTTRLVNRVQLKFTRTPPLYFPLRTSILSVHDGVEKEDIAGALHESHQVFLQSVVVLVQETSHLVRHTAGEVPQRESTVAAEPRLLVSGGFLVVVGVERGQQSSLVRRGAAVEQALLLQNH